MDLKPLQRASSRKPKRDLGKKDTYETSLDMFRDGKSIAEIAAERGLGVSTIEGHLASFVPTGKIRLDELVAVDKIEKIREAVVKFSEDGKLSPIKERLGDEYTYGEIRAVMAAIAGS
jgi:ATP-dependent DNA helicase RecQ